jgi:pimeloyl-ACP methyl ester carboxylesterase/predicted glycosyltransferase
MDTLARAAAIEPRAEPTRARYPDEQGYVERAGVKLFYELYGEGDPTILLLPTWSIIHSRLWKAQIPYLARHFRVLTFDGRGIGKSDRPRGRDAYAVKEFVDDALAVMDATGTERAVLVAGSRGCQWELMLAADHPDRVVGAAFVGAFLPVAPWPPLDILWTTFQEPSRTRRALRVVAGFRRNLPLLLRSRTMRLFARSVSPFEASDKFNLHYWERDYAGFLEWFFGELNLTEPHSTRQIEELIEWALGTDPDTLAETFLADALLDRQALRECCGRVQCPVVVMHGTHDLVCPFDWGEALAEATGGELIPFEGKGHSLGGRHPVRFNLALREFVEGLGHAAESDGRPARDPTVHRSDGRRRALFISSPIGLGHAQRDVAVARELRALVPDLEVDWLAQDPVTRVLEAEGERIHPASEHLANESRHMESESAEHDLHCFHAFRRMDEILCANFMLFHDVVRDERYDLWVGDEAWELDYYLHENPGEKRAPYVWLTDFVGFLPMPDGDERERFLTADYNAQMVEHVEGMPEVRDRSVFVGNPDDIVDERLGPDLPAIRDWTERHFDFPGYVTGFDPAEFADRAALRTELGYADDERVCIVTVGGSGVGEALLRKVIDAYPEAKRQVPELRMIVVAGPRIEPASLAAADGLEVRAYVHNLYRHLAACDLAVVQGGLTTGMELTANRRPFIYFPLAHHFEQNFHVRHRLERYGAGRRMDFEDSPAEAIAAAIAEEVGREVDYLPVETDGAHRAAERIAEVLR